MPKYIAIGVLAAVLLGCVVYQLLGNKAGAAARPTAANEPSAPAKATTTPPKADGTQVTPQQVIQVAVLPPPSKRDPFAACFTAEQFNAAQTRVVTSRPLPRLALASLPPLRNNLAISPIPPINVVPPEPVPKFVVTGVINGASRVAIIRAGESERYIVREGQFMNGKYLVKSVGRDGVVLTHGSRRIYLKLGGASDGS